MCRNGSCATAAGASKAPCCTHSARRLVSKLSCGPTSRWVVSIPHGSVQVCQVLRQGQGEAVQGELREGGQAGKPGEGGLAAQW